MGAAIPLLLPFSPPEADLPQSDGEARLGEEEFALALELATLPPELRPTSEPDGALAPRLPAGAEVPLSRPVETQRGESGASLPTAGLAPASDAPPAPAQGTPVPTSVEVRTPEATPAPLPNAALANPDREPTRVADPQTARAQTDATSQAVPDPLGTAATNPSLEEGAPRAGFKATPHDDLRSSIRTSRSSVGVEPSRTVQELANAAVEPEPQAFPSSAPVALPVAANDSAQAPLPTLIAPAPAPPLPAVGGGDAVRSELPSPPVPPEGLPLQIEWLAERGGGRARIQLHPPHLGHVELEVRTRGTEVEVVLNVGESAAHAPLQAQRQPLAAALAALDLDLASFEVANRDGGERRSQQQDSNEQSQRAPHKESKPGTNDAGIDLARTTQPAQRSRAAGIDVRI